MSPAHGKKTMDKKELALEVIARLKNEYPDTHCTLSYDDAWQLLVSVRLAAQCTDKRVDQTTPLLYAKFPTVKALADAPVEEIAEIVKPCGLGNSKARDISACMKVLHEKYNDHVPDTMEELLKLPGVGRKSANLVLGDVFGKPAIVTDTHCIRLSNRIGLVDDIKEPVKVEKALREIVPRSATGSSIMAVLSALQETRNAANAVFATSAGIERNRKQMNPFNASAVQRTASRDRTAKNSSGSEAMASSSCCFYVFLMLFLLCQYVCSVIQNAGSKARRNVGCCRPGFHGAYPLLKSGCCRRCGNNKYRDPCCSRRNRL